ncbi:activator-dependent family glycosyltransferase [Prauserella cavernicola]|uniref:Activator-dependent family glycosyltransferase n=1 Tax=Prauserella cavernicola TaxID=2800127 RepID=A0A934V6T2_9PSEU|nr:activator-dependent family glycosyltransferase [Prauserella cavernicola]MBK1787857.1 activator-dependent family glycosyltransferase [Prauserella cavernicola]
MRVLFTTYPEKAFFQAMAPLAWALRTAGHEVLFASQPELVDDIIDGGLTAVPVGRDHATWRLAESHPEETEAERAGLPSPYDAAFRRPEDLSWAEMTAGYRHHLLLWHKMDNFPMIDDLVALARHWKPDLVIWEPTTYAGAIAAKASGAAHARLLWSIDVFATARQHYLRLRERQPAEARTDPMGEWLRGYADRYGFAYDEDLINGQFTIDLLPESLRLEAPGLRYLPVQYVPYGGKAVVPDWLSHPPRRPRVALTLGITATNRFAGYTVDVQSILDSLSDLDIEVVAAIARQEQDKLARIPDNTRVVSFTPLHALMPTCSAVIHHAGPGTLRTTSRYGVPQLMLPWDFDEPELARGLAAQGAGLVLDPGEASGEAVRAHLLRLLREPEFALAAGRLRDDMLATPSPNELAGELERLCATYRHPSPEPQRTGPGGTP